MDDPLIGREIGNFIIEERLGAGGMAVVYKARQPSLNRHVAVKVLTGPLAQDEEFVARFRREAMTAGSLGHPNILTVHDAGTTEDGLHYIVMEYAPGGTLKDLLAGGPLPVGRAVEIGAQVGEALEAAHRAGIVHRDLKPSNVLFAGDGRALLMDFGVALRVSETRLTRTGMAVGTPEYMSPEQAQGRAVDGRSDVYSLGVLLYEMLTGDVPFVGDTPLGTLYRHVHEAVPDVRGSGVPGWLAEVVEGALAKEPGERYQGAGELAAALRAGEAGGAARPAVKRKEERKKKRAKRAAAKPAAAAAAAPARKRGWGFGWVLGIGALLALAAGATYLLFFQGVEERSPVIATQPGRVVLAQPTDTPALPTAILVTQPPATPVPAPTTAQPDPGPEQTATAVGAAIATAEARETEVARTVDQATRGAEAATATSVSLTAEAGRSLSDSLTAQAQATWDAQIHATETAQARPTATDTPPPPTPTPTPARRGEISDFETDQAWQRGDEPYGSLTRTSEQAHEGGFSGRLAYDFPTRGNDYVVFLHDQPLAGEPNALRIWVYGDGSGHFLNAWFSDAQGQTWQASFGQITHQGWGQMTASLAPGQDWPWTHISGPDNGRVDYPIDFRGLVLDDVPDSFAGRGQVYLDDLVAGTVAGGEPATTPAPSAPAPAPAPAALSGHIAFPVFNPQRGRYDVYVATADGRDRWLAVAEARQPDFRADGRLAVNGDGGGRDNVWAMNARGGEAKAISRHPEDAHPSWSGDGGRIAFDSLLGPHKDAPRLYVHDDLSAKQEPRVVLFGSYEIRGRVSTWLSDGRIVFNGCDYWATGSNCGLYAVGDGGGHPVRLSSGADDTAADAHGTRIAYMTRRDGNWEVYVMNWDGTGQQNLTRSPGNDGLPTWSPDGAWIAFASDRTGQWAIWAMRPDGGDARQLFPLEGTFGTGDYDWALEKISWGP